MKSREARKIVKSAQSGSQLYPRHILRKAALQLGMDSIQIGGTHAGDILFWTRGPMSGHMILGRWIPDFFTECSQVAREVGVCILTNDLNGTPALIFPGDSAECAYNRWAKTVPEVPVERQVKSKSRVQVLLDILPVVKVRAVVVPREVPPKKTVTDKVGAEA